MKYINKHCAIEEQIEILRKRNLIVDDEDCLRNVNYSHLIYKYGKHFLDLTTQEIKYKSGTKLSHIHNLYLFNNELASLIFEVLIIFEHALKRAVANMLTSENPLGYLEEKFYDETTIPKHITINFIENLKKVEEKKRNLYNSGHFIDGKLPLWLLIDEMSFGEITMILRLTKHTHKIAKELRISRKKIVVFFKTINEYRNAICHTNPISKTIITKSGWEVHFGMLLIFIRGKYPHKYKKITSFINGYDISKINMSLIDLKKILGVEEMF